MSKTALVTGASSGIGWEFAKVLANHAYNLIVVSRNLQKLNELKVEVESQYGVEVLVLPGDLSHPEIPEDIFKEVEEKQLTVDVLINNSGFGYCGFYKDCSWEIEKDMLQVNMVSLSHLTRLFLPQMLKRKNGRIVNVASTAAFQPGPLMASYYATKAYVLFYSEALANELKGTGVSVTTLCPGPTASGFQVAAKMPEAKLVQNRKLPTSHEVAEYGYDAMLKGKPVAVHGFKNRMLVLINRFMPRQLTSSIIRKIQETNR